MAEKHLEKYDDELNPTMYMTSLTENFFCSSSMAALRRRVCLM